MASKQGKEEESIYRIPPYFYIHVLDQNSNVTKVEVGPKTFIRQDNEKVCISHIRHNIYIYLLSLRQLKLSSLTSPDRGLTSYAGV